jgi:hypothetical protein
LSNRLAFVGHPFARPGPLARGHAEPRALASNLRARSAIVSNYTIPPPRTDCAAKRFAGKAVPLSAGSGPFGALP